DSTPDVNAYGDFSSLLNYLIKCAKKRRAFLHDTREVAFQIAKDISPEEFRSMSVEEKSPHATLHRRLVSVVLVSCSSPKRARGWQYAPSDIVSSSSSVYVSSFTPHM
ncbi:hypothetical protein CEXT_666881, partial [Caerostris extrusa]